jgi:hypothetical protein
MFGGPGKDISLLKALIWGEAFASVHACPSLPHVQFVCNNSSFTNILGSSNGLNNKSSEQAG